MTSDDNHKPAHKDKRNTPIRRYLIKALAKQGLTGAEWDCVMLIADKSYGWVENRQTKRRRDRAPISIEELVRDTKKSEPTIKRALQKLIKNNIIKVHEEAKKGTPRMIGIQSNPDLWSNLNRGSKMIPQDEPNRGSKMIPQRDQKRSPIRSKMIPHSESAASNDKGSRPAEYSIQYSTQYNKGGGEAEFENKFTPITSAREAHSTELNLTEAMRHAVAAWQKAYISPLSLTQERKLNGFFSAGHREGFLLACWLTAVRDTRKERASGNKWRCKFSQTLAKASDVFEEKTNMANRPRSYFDQPKPPLITSDDDEDKELVS